MGARGSGFIGRGKRGKGKQMRRKDSLAQLIDKQRPTSSFNFTKEGKMAKGISVGGKGGRRRSGH